jgi:hypothetical protein
VPNATRCDGTVASGLPVKYAVTSRDTLTSVGGSMVLPARGLTFFLAWHSSHVAPEDDRYAMPESRAQGLEDHPPSPYFIVRKWRFAYAEVDALDDSVGNVGPTASETTQAVDLSG